MDKEAGVDAVNMTTIKSFQEISDHAVCADNKISILVQKT